MRTKIFIGAIKSCPSDIAFLRGILREGQSRPFAKEDIMIMLGTLRLSLNSPLILFVAKKSDRCSANCYWRNAMIVWKNWHRMMIWNAAPGEEDQRSYVGRRRVASLKSQHLEVPARTAFIAQHLFFYYELQCSN